MDLLVKRAGENYIADWGQGPRVCAVGSSGIGEKRREGDGFTPLGIWPLRRVLYRADRVPAPKSALPLAASQRHDAWCDDPKDARYNTQISVSESATESLWREDALYDVIVVVGYNDAPVVAGKGSAIFIHIARPDYAPTAGCVALAREDLLEVVAQFAPGDCLRVIE